MKTEELVIKPKKSYDIDTLNRMVAKAKGEKI